MDKPEPIEGRCNARTKRGFCLKYPMAGKKRCRNHGGATPGGIASPHFKTGKDSSYLPQLPDDWAKHYADVDPELVTLQRELRLNLACIRATLEAVNSEVKAKQGKKQPASLIALWTQIEPMLKLHERLVATESRRLKDQQELIQRTEFARFMKAVLLIVAEYVSDRTVRLKIQDGVMRMLQIAAPPILEGKVG